MQPQMSQELNGFLEQIVPFRHLYKSVLLRATWADIEKKDRILALSVTLEQEAAKNLLPPKHRPDVGPLHTAWEAIDISRLEEVLNNLSSGFVEIEGKRLHLETHSGNQWLKWNSFHPTFDRPGDYPQSDAKFPMISLRGFGSWNATTFENVKDSRLSVHLKTLEVPFENVQDMQESFLGIPRSQRDQDMIVVSIRAVIPIILSADTNVHNGMLEAIITVPEAAHRNQVSLSLIESSDDRVLRRSAVKINEEAWKKEAGIWILRQEHTLLEKVTKTLLILKYAGVFLSQKSMVALHPNASMRVHDLLDKDNQQLLKCLSGQGKQRAEDFEKAVSWLFGFCGFNTQLYGHFPPVEENAVDLIAYSREAQTILGVECAVSHPETIGKMPKLVSRCRRMSEAVKDASIKVIPILATALEEVSQSERETAAQDEIALVSQKELLGLLQMAGIGKQPPEVIEHIKSLIATKSADPASGLFGMQ